MNRAFRLGGLLRLRQMQEEQAAAELARRNAQRAAAAARRQETEEMLAGSQLPEISDELVFRAAVAGRVALAGMVVESIAALHRAAAVADGAAEEWTAARVRAATLEKLEQRHADVVRAADEAAEQVALDEAAARGRLAPTEGGR